VAALVRWSLENAPVRYNPHKVAPGAFHPPRAGGYCTLTSDDESAMNRPEYATLTTLAGGGDSAAQMLVFRIFSPPPVTLTARPTTSPGRAVSHSSPRISIQSCSNVAWGRSYGVGSGTVILTLQDRGYARSGMWTSENAASRQLGE
jgi:hypothetical protein